MADTMQTICGATGCVVGDVLVNASAHSERVSRCAKLFLRTLACKQESANATLTSHR